MLSLWVRRQYAGDLYSSFSYASFTDTLRIRTSTTLIPAGISDLRLRLRGHVRTDASRKAFLRGLATYSRDARKQKIIRGGSDLPHCPSFGVPPQTAWREPQVVGRGILESMNNGGVILRPKSETVCSNNPKHRDLGRFGKVRLQCEYIYLYKKKKEKKRSQS